MIYAYKKFKYKIDNMYIHNNIKLVINKIIDNTYTNIYLFIKMFLLIFA